MLKLSTEIVPNIYIRFGDIYLAPSLYSLSLPANKVCVHTCISFYTPDTRLSLLYTNTMSRPTIQILTGYSPRYAVKNSGQFNMSDRLMFQGDERKYELWEVRFLGYLRTHKLYDTITAKMDELVNPNKNAETIGDMVIFLDDRSLSLIIRDAKNDERNALYISREHYLPRGKPKVIALYTELTSLLKQHEENITDYIIRAENAATFFKKTSVKL